MNATFRVGWSQRALGLSVLFGVLAVVVAMGFDLPWPTWIVLGVFGGAAAISTVSNFGERLRADDDGLVLDNVILRALRLQRERRAAWTEVVSAIELDRRTFFLSLDGRRRWVLDALDGQDELRALLQEKGVPVEQRTRPRLRDLGRGPRQPPG